KPAPTGFTTALNIVESLWERVYPRTPAKPVPSTALDSSRARPRRGPNRLSQMAAPAAHPLLQHLQRRRIEKPERHTPCTPLHRVMQPVRPVQAFEVAVDWLRLAWPVPVEQAIMGDDIQHAIPGHATTYPLQRCITTLAQGHQRRGDQPQS